MNRRALAQRVAFTYGCNRGFYAPMQTREAHLTVLSRMVFAKAKELKALDYTIGLVRRYPDKLDNKYPDMRPKLIELRQAVQSGFSMKTLLDNQEILGRLGSRLSREIVETDGEFGEFFPKLKSFLGDFEDSTDAYLKSLRGDYEEKIAKALNVPVSDLLRGGRIPMDKIEDAYQVMFDDLDGHFKDIMATIKRVGAEAGGGFKIKGRLKAPDSVAGKIRERLARGEATSLDFLDFSDLVGTRVIAKDLQGVLAAMSHIEKSFKGKVLRKRNYYLVANNRNPYQGVNYIIALGPYMVELQVSAELDRIAANLMHDLTYSDEKAFVKLNDEQKSLIALVIDLLTQLSFREWQEIISPALAEFKV